MFDVLEDIKAIGSGVIEGIITACKWYWMTIKKEKKLSNKIILIILPLIDMILLPIKAIIIPILYVNSKAFRSVINEIGQGVEDDLRESEL